jgi:Protein of unknown function (DUF3826)
MWPLLLISAACLVPQSPAAKADDLAYTRTLEKRASDVLDELRLDDRAIAERARGIIVDQFRGLRTLHDARDAKVREIQADKGLESAAKAARIESELASGDAASASLNDRFLAALAKDLSPAQVETVKDKMTYHKLQITYDGYLEMLPKLTTEQKKVVFDTLKEARDKAVYAGSAEEKTAIFGRSKGRVNNYLSSQGYDLKLAAKEWAERRKAGK